MKTSRSLTRELSLLAGGLLICLPAGFAAPGGAGTTGTASAGGGHAASAAPVASAHTSGGSAHASVGIASGLHSGLSSNLGVSTYRGVGVASSAARSVNPTANNGGVSGNYSTLRSGLSPANTGQIYAPVNRANNAWTDPVNPRVSAVGGFSRYGTYVASARRNDPVYINRPANGYFQRGQSAGDRSRGPHRYYYNNFPYGVYYPYLYNTYGVGGYGNLGYEGSIGVDPGLRSDTGNSDLGAPDFSNNANNYYSYAAPEQDAQSPASAAPAQPLPDASAIGPQTPSSAGNFSAASQGPDSLVEAVQDELCKRGYFAEKPDATYSPATKEAIRRFQTDQHLPATSRINEATLHALRLD